MRLRTWLILGYSAVLALATLGLGLGLVTVLSLADTAEAMVEDNLAALDVASRLRRLTSAQQLVVARRLGAGDTTVVASMHPFERQTRALLDEARARADTDPLERDAIERGDRALEALVAAVGLAQPSAPVAPGATSALTPEVVSAFESVHAATLDYYNLHHAKLQERGSRISLQADRLAVALALLAGFTVLVGVLVSLRLAAGLSKPMERMANAAARVADGDFDVRVGRMGVLEADFVAQRFDDMTAALGRFHAMNLDRIVAETRRLDQVVANIEEGLLIFDESGRIERANPAACALIGHDCSAIIGKSLPELRSPAVLSDAVALALANPYRVLAPTSGDLTIGEGEELRTLVWSLVAFSDAARFGLILALRDVTAARQFERMRTDFVLRASHELRTPITGMRMAFGMLEGKLGFAPDSREGELVSTLRDETQRMVNLVNALLDLSRLYAGSYALERSEVDPGALLQRARQRFAPMAEAKGIELVLQLPASLPTLVLDEGALDRVLDNLVGNALRHTPAAGRITLAAEVLERTLEISVRDTGEGIAHADRARVFEPFVQIGSRVGGVGLGLAMCREILRQHRGHVRLDSAPGRGSCFTLSLPRETASVERNLPAEGIGDVQSARTVQTGAGASP